MSVKDTIRQHHKRKIDAVSDLLRNLEPAPEGWITTLRKALGLSGVQLAKRVGVTRAAINQAERNERDGAITIQHMQRLAEAMGGHYVHALILPSSVDDALKAQALKKATAAIKRASAHMALESQSLSHAQNKLEIERLANQLLLIQPADFWNEP